MIGPEGPCPPTFLYRLDVIVDPTVGDGAAFVRDFELLQESLEPRHEDDASRCEEEERRDSRGWTVLKRSCRLYVHHEPGPNHEWLRGS